MKLSLKIVVVVTLSLFVFVVFVFIKQNLNAQRDIALLNNKDSITSLTITLITCPNCYEKKIIKITDREVLDSINYSIKNNNPSDKQVAKLNEIYAIIEITKCDKKINFEIVNSKFTGWLLIFDNNTFTNDKVIDIFQKLLI